MDNHLIGYHLTHRQQTYQRIAEKERFAQHMRQQQATKKSKRHNLRFYLRYLVHLFSRWSKGIGSL